MMGEVGKRRKTEKEKERFEQLFESVSFERLAVCHELLSPCVFFRSL
jgi:hypothetical protein